MVSIYDKQMIINSLLWRNRTIAKANIFFLMTTAIPETKPVENLLTPISFASLNAKDNSLCLKVGLLNPGSKMVFSFYFSIFISPCEPYNAVLTWCVLAA